MTTRTFGNLFKQTRKLDHSSINHPQSTSLSLKKDYATVNSLTTTATTTTTTTTNTAAYSQTSASSQDSAASAIMGEGNHKDVRQWHAPVPVHLMLWLEERVSTILLAVKKPWIVGKGDDFPFAVVLKQHKVDRPFIWIQSRITEEGEKKMLQLSVTAESNNDFTLSYIVDRIMVRKLTVGGFFQLLVQYGFDHYQFADPGNGRDWVFNLRKFLLDRTHLVYHPGPEQTPLEICSAWWDQVEDGIFTGSPGMGPFWDSKESKERFEAVKRCLAEAGT